MLLFSKENIVNITGTTNEQARTIWVAQTLKKIPAGSRILDAGAGEQKFKPFCAHLNYIAQDFSRYDGKGDNSGLQTGSWDQSGLDIVSDITAIPEPDASFDAIMCIEVFEHLPDPLKALCEFTRLLRPQGYLILTAPFCSLTHFAPFHFASGFNSYFYSHHLEQNGFTILEIQRNGNYFEYIAQELRRLPFIAQRYAVDGPSSGNEVAALNILLEMLGRFSQKDIGSSELLAYGYHVFAMKR
jgi:ubiquinone/menaquinone biosynthesis C-methylase UbiE